ncbi:YojF family protein [soil metagenome]
MNSITYSRAFGTRGRLGYATHDARRRRRSVVPIDVSTVQAELERRVGHDLFMHLETTTGSYTALGPEKRTPVIAFVRNAPVRPERGSITGPGPYRVGLKLPSGGWIYAEGLTDFEVSERDELLLAGHDAEGNITVALQLSAQPFRE